MVKKSTLGKYQLVNIVVKLNQVIIKNVNLPSSTDEFFKEFADYAISSLIDFFSSDDQVKPDEKSQDFIVFMTSLGLMQMTTLLQGATNSVVQFVQIVLKILAPHLQDQAKLFLDDVGIKKPKTKYINKQIVSEIRHYVFQHIQNMDKVLVDLRKLEL